MHTRGVIAPETVEAARDMHDRLEPVARAVVEEAATAMAFDREEYEERVTPDVIERARGALFASLLEVSVGSREEFEAWAADHDGEVVTVGSKHVDGAVWHAPAFADTAVAATFQNEPDAAVDALRRQVYGRLYRDLFDGPA